MKILLQASNSPIITRYGVLLSLVILIAILGSMLVRVDASSITVRGTDVIFLAGHRKVFIPELNENEVSFRLDAQSRERQYHETIPYQIINKLWPLEHLIFTDEQVFWKEVTRNIGEIYTEKYRMEILSRAEKQASLLMRFIGDTQNNFLKETVPQSIPVHENMGYSFSVQGQIHYGVGHATGTDSGIGPDGIEELHTWSFNPPGITGFLGPAGALVGVFLDRSDPFTWSTSSHSTPVIYSINGEELGNVAFWAIYPHGERRHSAFDGNDAPYDDEILEFNETVFPTSFLEAHPAIGQVFFIGDGLTETGKGDVQTFVAPLDATRLFLGVADSWNFYTKILASQRLHQRDLEWGTRHEGAPGYYTDNDGAFTVQVTEHTKRLPLVEIGR